MHWYRYNIDNIINMNMYVTITYTTYELSIVIQQTYTQAIISDNKW